MHIHCLDMVDVVEAYRLHKLVYEVSLAPIEDNIAVVDKNLDLQLADRHFGSYIVLADIEIRIVA